MKRMNVISDLSKLIKNNHRHPANRLLHVFGFPMYVAGILMIIGHFVGLRTDPVAGVVLWLVSISMFLAGHKIEGNLDRITPVLIFRLLRVRLKRSLYLVSN